VEINNDEKAFESPATKHEKILEGRKKLPVYPYREEFLMALKEHQVLVLLGETGCYSLHIFGASIRSRLGRDFIRLVSMRVRLYLNADCYLGTKRYAWGVSHKCDSSVCKQLGHTTGPYLGNILYWKIEAGVSLPAIFSTLWGTTTL
jgi:hypothetical protein